MKNCSSTIALVSVIAGLASASAARADFVDVSYQGKQQGRTVKVTSALLTGDVFAGQLRHTLSDGPSGLNGDWISFCTDLAQHVSQSASSYEIVDASLLPDGGAMGAAKAQAIADLYAHAGGLQLLTTTSDDLACAFQLALWEIITDYNGESDGYGLDVTAGGFKATKTNGDALSAGVMAELTSLFAAVGVAGGSTDSLIGLRSGSKQDQLIYVPGPGALALAGLAIGGLGRRRRADGKR